MVNKQGKLKLAGKSERSVKEQLSAAGFRLEELTGGTYRITSSATGAVVMPVANERDLISMLRCMEYTAGRHGDEMGTKYTIPVHC
jgi:hypothetical protein